jgi:hypothetical protein
MLFRKFKNKFYWLLIVCFVVSCTPKFYSKNDYSFYKKDFVLDSSSLLKTNGIYVLESSWSDKSGFAKKLPSREFFTFYKTGQANLILSDSLKSNIDYIETIKATTVLKKSTYTLFQGYFKIEKNKIIIQSVNAPLRQFYYYYGFVENNKLIIVKQTISSKGKFKNKYFVESYKDTYTFIAINNFDVIPVPNW